MSVIQEALRRKMAEQRARDAAEGKATETDADASPSTYVPPPLLSRPPRPRPHADGATAAGRMRSEPAREGPAVTPVWIVMMLLAFAVVAVMWLQTMKDQQARRTATAGTQPAGGGVALATPLPPAAAPRPESAPAVPPAVAAAPAPAAMAGGIPEAAAPVPMATVPVVAAAPLPAPVVAAPAEAAAPPPAAVRAPGSMSMAPKQATVTRDDWPKVELMGVLAGTKDRKSTAILNGTLVMLEGEIDGVTLAEVTEEGVYLEFEGDRQFIRIGEHTR